MQLKRDTDYALRILYCIGKNFSIKGVVHCGLTLPEICMQSGVPKLAANRLCEKLLKKGIIRSRKRRSETIYYPSGQFKNQSLLGIIETTENTAQLFAVFDKKNGLFRRYGEKLETIQDEIEEVLSNATLKFFIRDE
ncbi:MAG: Rrf2 family transcriptional regulator [Clostridia bacterium]|nr:Rrf2 family transcriptional regulator [Clostridia bacterium]